MRMMGEMPFISHSKEKGEMKGVYERVCEGALEILSRERGEEALKRARDIINNSEFEASVRERWKVQTLDEIKRGVLEDDAAEQEKTRITGLVIRLKQKIDN